MSIQITILGLGRIGASAGLVLGRHSNQNELQVTEMPKAGDFWKQQVGGFSRLSGTRPLKREKKD